MNKTARYFQALGLALALLLAGCGAQAHRQIHHPGHRCVAADGYWDFAGKGSHLHLIYVKPRRCP